jgi:hypothetical protein
MRKVFSSLRLENVEAVAQLLGDAGIEVRITDGRSYKGKMRSRASYSDQSAVEPAVWVVHSEDHIRARAVLRDNGLLESTRPTDSFQPLSFRNDEAVVQKSPAQKRMFRFKMVLLAGMAVIIVLAMLRGCYAPRQVVAPAAPVVSDQAARAGGTPESLALAVFAKEVAKERLVLCLAIDDADASGAVIAAMKQPTNEVVPMSQCVREFDPRPRQLPGHDRQAGTAGDGALVQADRPGRRHGRVRILPSRPVRALQDAGSEARRRCLAGYESVAPRRLLRHGRVTRGTDPGDDAGASRPDFTPRLRHPGAAALCCRHGYRPRPARRRFPPVPDH